MYLPSMRSRRSEGSKKKRSTAYGASSGVVVVEKASGRAYYGRARTCMRRGEFVQAVDLLDKAFRSKDANPLWMLDLAQASLSARRFERALQVYDAALVTFGRTVSIVANRAVALRGVERIDEAIEACREAIYLDPNLVGPRANLGLYLRDALRFDEAEAVLTEALRDFPANQQVLHQLASLANRRGRAGEALVLATELTALHPDYPDGHVTRGMALLESGKLDDAQVSFERAKALADGHGESCKVAEWNLALLAASNGNLEVGLQGLEAREHISTFVAKDRQLPGVEWDGTDLSGKVIFVSFEQGIGDLLQFVRYARELKQRGARRVVIETPETVASLIRTVPGVDDIAIFGSANLPPYDVRARLMSLAYLCNTRMESIPSEVPYLHVTETPVASIVRAAPGKLKVGIVWGGNPSNSRDPYRSVPLAALLPVIHMEGLSFFSLQKGPHAQSVLPWMSVFPIIDLGPHLASLEDTASAILQLDVVISICTSVAHLSGALGQRTFTLLHHPPDWRWFRGRNDSPWYPTMTLFRQDTPGDWSRPLGLLRDALKKLGASQSG